MVERMLRGLDLPPAFQDPALDEPLAAVQAAWYEAWATDNPEHPRFVAALRALADAARAVGAPLTELLAAADALTRPEKGGDDRLAANEARRYAAGRLSYRYYRRE